MDRGIVIHAGGSAYLLNAFVATRMLRHVGCTLPVQWWYAGSREFLSYMPELAWRVGATLQNFAEIRRQVGAPMLSGWARKPFSMLHCPFDEVMLLDADLVVVRDPAYLFDHPLCTEHGCLFWPDFKPLPPDHIVWKACCIPYDGGVSFQGGQQIIDKRRCREALELTVRFNYDWEVWYELIHGEQDTYRYCWGMTGTRYNVVPGKPGVLKHTILEYDPEGHRVFQHRCADKWSLEGNSSVPDFWFEPDCLKYVEEFRKVKESLAKRSSTNGATSSSVASSAALLCRA